MIEFLWAICGVQGAAASGWGIVLALGLAGVLGGIGHCSLMCGPFVLAQVADRFAAGATQRLGAALLLPYQVGRISSYAALGAIAGGFGGAVTWLADAPWLARTALVVAGTVFALQGLGALRLGGQGWLAATLARRRIRGVGLGIALGFLPCGLVYGALIASTGAGGALMGGLSLAAFGVGTVPALAAVGWLGLAAGKRWLKGVRAIAPILSLVNATVLLALAYRAM